MKAVYQSFGGLLAEQVDAFAQALQQRDIARSAAVALEQENAHLRGCIAAAAKVLSRMGLPCKCVYLGEHSELVICELCELRGFLADAETP